MGLFPRAMPQSLSSVYLHMVFSTKERFPFLSDRNIRGEVHAFLGGIAKKLDCPPLRVGGVSDHVHLLLGLGRGISQAEVRTVLHFHPRMAPVKCGVFPLLKNKPELVAKAREIVASLRPHMDVAYDEAAAIGKRYRRQDEVGTPFCVTVDFDTIGENGPEKKDTITLRDRDSMQQVRMPIAELKNWLLEKIS